jgi:hypothetical protein
MCPSLLVPACNAHKSQHALAPPTHRRFITTDAHNTSSVDNQRGYTLTFLLCLWAWWFAVHSIKSQCYLLLKLHFHNDGCRRVQTARHDNAASVAREQCRSTGQPCAQPVRWLQSPACSTLTYPRICQTAAPGFAWGMSAVPPPAAGISRGRERPPAAHPPQHMYAAAASSW